MREEEFNPYRSWLGIPREELPANHYRLLGLSLYESDLQIIESAADRQMTHVKKYQIGQHAAICQRLLNEISQAAGKLRNPVAKAAYDAELEAKLNPPPTSTPVLPIQPVAVTLPVPPVPQPHPVPRPLAVPAPHPSPTPPTPPFVSAQPTSSTQSTSWPRLLKPRKKNTNAAGEVLKIVAGSVAGLFLGWLLLRMIGKSKSIDDLVVVAQPPPMVATPAEPKQPATSRQQEVKPPPAVTVPMSNEKRQDPITLDKNPIPPLSPTTDSEGGTSLPLPPGQSSKSNPPGSSPPSPITPAPPTPAEIAVPAYPLPPAIPPQPPTPESRIEQTRESMEYAVLLYDYLQANLADETKRDQARKVHDLAVQIISGGHPEVQLPMNDDAARRFQGHYISRAQTPVIGNLPNSNLRTISIISQLLPRGANRAKLAIAERISAGLDQMVVDLQALAEHCRASGEIEAADSHLLLMCACRAMRLSFERRDHDHWELLNIVGSQFETARLTIKDAELRAANSEVEEKLLDSFDLMTTATGEFHRDLRQTFSMGKTILQHRQDGRWEESTDNVKVKLQEISRTKRLIVLQNTAGTEQTYLSYNSCKKSPVGSPPPETGTGGSWRILSIHQAW